MTLVHALGCQLARHIRDGHTCVPWPGLHISSIEDAFQRANQQALASAQKQREKLMGSETLLGHMPFTFLDEAQVERAIAPVQANVTMV